MTNFINKNTRFLFLLLGVLLSSSLHAITFRNQPLSNFIKKGEVLYSTFPKNSFAMLEIAWDNFDIREGNIEDIDNLEEIFHKVIAGRSGCSISSRMVDLSSNIIDANSSYYTGQEYINIQARTSLQFIHCLFQSPLISIGGNKMNFDDCFLINPKVLNINLNSSGSDYDIIQVLFYDQPKKPTVITGEIDLKNNQTTTKLIISNVKEIRVQFKSNKNVPQTNSNLEDQVIILPLPKINHTRPQPTHNYFQEIVAFSKKYIFATITSAFFLFMACYAWGDTVNED